MTTPIRKLFEYNGVIFEQDYMGNKQDETEVVFACPLGYCIKLKDSDMPQEIYTYSMLDRLIDEERLKSELMIFLN